MFFISPKGPMTSPERLIATLQSIYLCIGKRPTFLFRELALSQPSTIKVYPQTTHQEQKKSLCRRRERAAYHGHFAAASK